MKPKFDRYLSIELRRAILHDAKAAAHGVNPAVEITPVAHSRDADDAKFLHAALAAQAQWLVTGDQGLLVLAAGWAASGSSTKIPPPSEALQAADFCR